MEKVSDKTIKFLKDHVTELNKFLPLDDDKRYDLIHAVEEMFVIPLANASGAGQAIDEKLLHEADDVVDDLNNEDLDFADFNKRIK